jgi:hypothetical protein
MGLVLEALAWYRLLSHPPFTRDFNTAQLQGYWL